MKEVGTSQLVQETARVQVEILPTTMTSLKCALLVSKILVSWAHFITTDDNDNKICAQSSKETLEKALGVIHKPCGHDRGGGFAKCPCYFIRFIL